ncbi:MAG: Holliday junction branch migration protein RuvA [Pseudomonadota bacterium]
MIGKITGALDHCGTDYALVEAGGVGYIVHCSERTLASMPAPGGTVSLYTTLIVREDLMQLFGFATLEDRAWHGLLTSVQGVGAKGAVTLLGALGADGVQRAISLGDAAALRRAPGIGPKTAARIAMELKDKGPGPSAMGRSTPLSAPQARADAHASEEALSALVNLGYERGDAAAAIRAVSDDAGNDTAGLIRLALKRLAPGAGA